MQFRFLRIAAGVIGLLWPLLLPGTAGAQPLGKAVVITFGIREDVPALDLAAEAEEQLATRHIPLISMHDARDRFRASSRPPQDPTRSDLEALAKEARQAVEHVAFGRSAAAEQSVRDIVTLAERSLESLNRESRNARQLLDACLALVRSSLHEGQREQAIEQAMGCRRLVPDLAPNASAQPANVIGVLAEADDELRRMRIGRLRVENTPPRPCSVYLNGRHLGMTPFALDRAAVGAYRVQVECDEKPPGRVHIVHLGDQPVELRVDSEFDRSVATEPRLGLSYAESASVRSSLLSHAVQLGREIHAEDVILARRSAKDFELIRINVKHRQVIAAARGSLDAAGTPSDKALSDTLDALTQGRFVGVAASYYAPKPDLKVSSPGADGPLRPSDGGASSKRIEPVYKKWWLWTAVGLVVAGGVATGLVLGLRGHRDKSADEPIIGVPSRSQ